MSKQASAYRVGSFVIAGVVLAVILTLTFGGGRFFSHRAQFILYFADSVHGLSVGSPVKFKGVPIGSVKRIQVALREGQGPQYIPVLVEVDQDLVLSASGEPVDIRDPRFVRSQIEEGLRGSLELESFITGRLYVQFDYASHPAPPVFVQRQSGPIEIPTISTGLSEFLNSLERVDVPGLSRRINAVLDDLQQLLADPQLKQVGRQLVRSLDAFERFVAAPELTNALSSVTRTSDQAQVLLADLSAKVGPLSGSLTNTADQAAQTLVELRHTLDELRRLLAPDAPLLGEVHGALQEFSDAARAVRLLADYLNRNPRALLTGRKPPEAKP